MDTLVQVHSKIYETIKSSELGYSKMNYILDTKFKKKRGKIYRLSLEECKELLTLLTEETSYEKRRDSEDSK